MTRPEPAVGALPGDLGGARSVAPAGRPPGAADRRFGALRGTAPSGRRATGPFVKGAARCLKGVVDKHRPYDPPVASDRAAFICYVRENKGEVDDLASAFTAAGIPVWRDTESLWPGQNWKHKIREAITEGAFAFIACFSAAGVAREVSGQYPELYMAAEEHRRRRPGVPWIFPVRFDDCTVPDLDLGGGVTLGDIQRADLFGPDRERNLQRLIGGVTMILQSQAPQTPPPQSDPTPPSTAAAEPTLTQQLKTALRTERSDIIVHDLVMPIADRARFALTDPAEFPTQGTGHVRDVADLIDRQWIALDELIDALVVAGLWGTAEHDRTWTEVAQRIGLAIVEHAGLVVLLQARRFALLPVVYATGIASVYRNNYGPLRAVAVDATVKELDGRVPVVARSSPWSPFSEMPLTAQVLALEASGEVVSDEVLEALRTKRRGNRYTPGSDLLHDRLRPKFLDTIVDDDEYSETFDKLEVLLGLLVADLRIRDRSDDARSGPWIPNPTTGRFTWRDRYANNEHTVERRMLASLVEAGEAWPPLRAGMFDGSVARANAAFDYFIPIAEEGRKSRW